MRETKERILLTALELFSERGFDAVSVAEIAAALGITKGAIYRHFESKRAVLESILRRMEQNDCDLAAAFSLPEGSIERMPERYRNAELASLIDFSRRMFRYWTEEPFARAFRRMLTVEQYRNAEMSALYAQYLGAGPMEYVAELLDGMGLSESREAAACLFGSMHLLFSAYDTASDKAKVSALAENTLILLGRELAGRIEKKEEQHNEISFG